MQQPYCNPGDIAVVIKAHNAVNIGTILQVHHLYFDQTALSIEREDFLWEATAPHPMTYSFGTSIRKRRTGPVPDSYLRRISSFDSKISWVKLGEPVFEGNSHVFA